MGVIDDVKSVTKLIQEIDNVDLYRKILDLQSEIMDMIQENNKLKVEMESSKEKFKFKDSVNFRNGAYWKTSNEGAPDGPYCPCCWDSKKEMSR